MVNLDVKVHRETGKHIIYDYYLGRMFKYSYELLSDAQAVASGLARMPNVDAMFVKNSDVVEWEDVTEYIQRARVKGEQGMVAGGLLRVDMYKYVAKVGHVLRSAFR